MRDQIRTENEQLEKPFFSGGEGLYTAKEVASALAQNADAWVNPAKYIESVLYWLESNLEFDAATKLAEEIETSGHAAALLSFVRSNREGEFPLLPYIANVNNLRVILSNAVSGLSTEPEKAALSMIYDGKLAAFLKKRSADTGDESEITELLTLLAFKEPLHQLRLVEAILEPGRFCWPLDADISTEASRIAFLKKSGLVVVNRAEIMKEITNPAAYSQIFVLFEKTKSYPAGLARIGYQSSKLGYYSAYSKWRPPNMLRAENAATAFSEFKNNEFQRIMSRSAGVNWNDSDDGFY